MSSIVTFYSYKGGVGRSMALANVAVLLARRGLRVLVVDWDLEAPGLDRYFVNFPMYTWGAGLLRLLVEAAEGKEPHYRDFVWEVNTRTPHSITFLPSGKEQDSEYTVNMENFDWEGFFRNKNGGRFVEMLRDQWRREFDVVLIDSRTGLSDTGGICTIQLPDIVVAMFTANHQSVYGVRDVMRLAQHARQTLAIDRMPLTILPLPARFGTRAEFKESQEWLDRFEEALQEFYDDWLPSWVRPRHVLERIKVPQIDYFSFGEKLAVVEHGVSDPEGMGYIYDRIATVLASDFSAIEALVGQEVAAQASVESRKRERKISSVRGDEEYKYDIFVSHAGNQLASEWTREMLKTLTMWVESLTGQPLNVFFDIQELQYGETFAETFNQALKHSKLLLAIAEPRYFRNEHALAEWHTFEIRSQATGASLIMPVVTAGSPSFYPDWFMKYQYVDLREFFYLGDVGDEFRQTTKYIELQDHLRKLASNIVEALKRVPAFDPDWPVATPSEAKTLIESSNFPELPEFDE